MNYRAKIDEFSQFFDSQLINANQCGEMDEYRAFLIGLNKKLAETLSKTYELEQHSLTLEAAQTQDESRKRNRNVAMNTSLPLIQSQGMECPMPSKRAKERAMISCKNVSFRPIESSFFGISTHTCDRFSR